MFSRIVRLVSISVLFASGFQSVANTQTRYSEDEFLYPELISMSAQMESGKSQLRTKEFSFEDKQKSVKWYYLFSGLQGSFATKSRPTPCKEVDTSGPFGFGLSESNASYYIECIVDPKHRQTFLNRIRYKLVLLEADVSWTFSPRMENSCQNPSNKYAQFHFFLFGKNTGKIVLASGNGVDGQTSYDLATGSYKSLEDFVLREQRCQ